MIYGKYDVKKCYVKRKVYYEDYVDSFGCIFIVLVFVFVGRFDYGLVYWL